MYLRLFSVCLLILVSSCATQKSTPVNSGVLYFDKDTGFLSLSVERLDDVKESFSNYAKFAHANGVSDIENHILLDVNIFTLDEKATLVYAKINDIERERIKQAQTQYER